MNIFALELNKVYSILLCSLFLYCFTNIWARPSPASFLPTAVSMSTSIAQHPSVIHACGSKSCYLNLTESHVYHRRIQRARDDVILNGAVMCVCWK